MNMYPKTLQIPINKIARKIGAFFQEKKIISQCILSSTQFLFINYYLKLFINLYVFGKNLFSLSPQRGIVQDHAKN